MTHAAEDVEMRLDAVRAAQQVWLQTSLRERLRLVRRLRARLAQAAVELAETVPLELPGSLHRTLADTLVAEVLPLAEACRFLEREAAYILASRRESTSARPLWLSGVEVEVTRQPLGVVLILAAANYPLLLPGVQALQALTAGNAVQWKPAPGCSAPARALRRMLLECGLDPLLLEVVDEDVEAASALIQAGVDKVILTGGENTGRAVMRECAEKLTPSVMELSGCDAVFVTEGADLSRVVEAIAFGLRLNGSATCMAPRRIFVTTSVADALLAKLKSALAQLPPVPVPLRTLDLVSELRDDARQLGAAIVCGGIEGDTVRPLLLAQATPDMKAVQTDVFAPMISVMQTSDEGEALGLYARCPYALTAAVFGSARAAERLALRIRAGVVIINDLIVPTADPRVSFGGIGKSGFGRTRGREGLLEMTSARAVVRQRSKSLLAYRPTTDAHIAFFEAIAKTLHGGDLRTRLEGLRETIKAAQKLGR